MCLITFQYRKRGIVALLKIWALDLKHYDAPQSVLIENLIQLQDGCN